MKLLWVFRLRKAPEEVADATPAASAVAAEYFAPEAVAELQTTPLALFGKRLEPARPSSLH